MEKRFYEENFSIGILGGGQLGRMFIQEALNLDVNISILDPDPKAPCSKLVPDFRVGSLQDFDTVYEFGKEKDVVTIEIEHVNVDALEKLESEGVKVFPRPSNLRIVQDKGLQKKFYSDHLIPTAPYYLVENKEEIKKYISEFPFMQKMRTGGYDGKGVTALKSMSDLEGAFEVPSVLEKFVDFEKEIAVIIARNEAGEVKSYPIVELEFNPEANLVEYLFAPATVSDEVEKEAQAVAEKLINALDFVGLLAVEMFLTKDGKILVNEIAPRPHNSGHHTIEANITSQYKQLLRSILNLPLGATDAISAAVMVNVLGAKGYTGNVIYENVNDVLATKGAKLHLYGKKTTKPFRKMGHITVVDPELAKAKERAVFVKEKLIVKA